MRIKNLYFVLVVLMTALTTTAQKTRQASWQQKVDYVISVRLDDQNHMLRGFETMEYYNNSPDELTEIFIHIWPNAYKNKKTAYARQVLENGETKFHFAKTDDLGYIDSLDFFVNGQSNPWNFDTKNPDIVRIVLNTPLKPGSHCSISTPFLVKIPKVFSRLGHDGQTYNITQWYPKPAVYDVNGWNPMPYLNQGEFYSDFGSFTVKITLPKNYMVAATGVLQEKEEANFRAAKGKTVGEFENTFCKTPEKTVTFKQDKIHDFAWFASKNFGMLYTFSSIGGRDVDTYIFSENEKDLTYDNTDAIRTALTYYSDNAGNYPYEHATVVKSSMKAGGGMEYPMITVCDILNREVIIHEVGHNWFYGILGSNERRYPWMDESINSYFESEAMKKRAFIGSTKKEEKKAKQKAILDNLNDYGMELIAVNAVRNNTSQAVGLPSEDYTNLNYGTMVYGKGSLIFKHLRGYLGDDLFKQCFKAYFDKWKYKHPLPGDMEDVFEQVSGKDLDWFFRDLIELDKPLDPKIREAHRSLDGSSRVVISKKNRFGPLPIGIYDDQKLISTLWVDAGKDTLVVPVGTLYTHFVVDPDRLVFDKNRRNNRYEMRKVFPRVADIKLKPVTLPDATPARNIFYMPMAGYNIHNGFMLGFAIHNWGFPQKPFEYFIAPMYGFKSKTWDGYSMINYKILTGRAFQSIDLGWNRAAFAYYTPRGVQIGERYEFKRNRFSATFNIRPKTLRSPVSQKFILEYTDVSARWLQKYTYNKRLDPTDPSYEALQAPMDYGFGRVTYKLKNNRVIDPFDIRLSLESGKIKGEDIYFKPGLELNYFKTYKKTNKGFSMRLFAGAFSGGSGNAIGLFNYRLGDKNGAYDYGMEQVLMGRGAGSGLWSSNITPTDDNLKIKGTIGNLTKPFVSLNLSSTLPGKIPLKPYADLCYIVDDYAYLNSEHFLYTCGIDLEIIPGILDIYFPLLQSTVITDVQNLQKNTNTFGKRICFTLNLNELNPRNLVQKAKLF